MAWLSLWQPTDDVYKVDWSENDYINYEDWNRIESNILALAAYLRSLSYTVPTQTYVTDRDEKSIDYLSSINRIENNLDAIRLAFLNPVGYLDKKTWVKGSTFDYRDANRLESNTKQLYLDGMTVFQSFRYCNAFNCGQEWGIL